MIITINADYFSVQQQPFDLSSANGLCSL